jgi:hypothetical protein
VNSAGPATPVSLMGRLAAHDREGDARHLLAGATATSLKGFFSISFFAPIRSGSVCGLRLQSCMRADGQQFAQKSIAHLRHAPKASACRPKDFCLDVKPRKAANSRGSVN